MNEFDFADRSIEIAREIRKMAIDKDARSNRRRKRNGLRWKIASLYPGCIMQYIMLLDIC